MKKNGQIITDDGNPIEGKALENALMLLADPQDGDTITYNATSGLWVAGSGSGGGGLVVNVVAGDTPALDKTYQEIEDAIESGTNVICREEIDEGVYSVYCVTRYGEADGAYLVYFGEYGYITDSKSGYPSALPPLDGNL